jgi:glycerophosphoryl diester phosphodiesterase
MSEYAYDHSGMRGYGAIEFSSRRSGDGVWFGIHDDTLARTSKDSGLTASITTMTWAEIQVQLNSLNSNGVSQPYYKLDDFLAKYTDHILIVDNKPGSQHTSEFLPKLLAVPNAKDRIILKHDGVQSAVRFQESKAAGFKVAGYFYAVNYVANLPSRAPYTDYIGMEYTTTQAVWDDILAYGKMTWGHVCPNQTAYDTAIARGADFVQCSGIDIITPVR